VFDGSEKESNFDLFGEVYTNISSLWKRSMVGRNSFSVKFVSHLESMLKYVFYNLFILL